MNLEQLRAFVEVVRQKTLSRAAEELGLSQSTLSFRIKGLEVSLGVKLLDRGGARASTTESGRILLPYAQRILGTAAEATLRVQGKEEEPGGEVLIAASTVPAEYLLPRQMAAFRGANSGISLAVQVHDSRSATRALLDGECDLAFVGARPADARRILSRPFATDEIVLAGTNRASMPDAMGPNDVATVPWIRRGAGSGTRAAVERLLQELGCTVAGDVEVSSTEAVRRCILADLGVAFVSRAAVEADVAAGRLKIVAFPGTRIGRQFLALRLRSRTPTAAAEAFWSHICSEP